MLASLLKSQELRKWIDSELSGYTGDIEVPEYRKDWREYIVERY